MTTAIIVQARMGSSRLPGKVMLDLAGKPVLQHVLERCRRIASADVVVCAMPDEEASQALADIARMTGAECFFGSEFDVLSRYAGAARQVAADTVMRVTSDCPLIDANICERVLQLRRDDDLDYAANNMPPSFPHGLDCEAMSYAALDEADRRATDSYDREHVTPWLRRACNRGNVAADRAGLDQLRWTLDYPEDLVFFRAVFAAADETQLDTLDGVLAVLETTPSLSHLNAMHHRSVPTPGAQL